MIRRPRFPRFIRSLEIFTEQQCADQRPRNLGQRVARTFFEWSAPKIPGRHVSTFDYAAADETFRVSTSCLRKPVLAPLGVWPQTVS
jgi:hypothetical protein